MLRGCESAGYRLTGALLEHVCCRHLYGPDRMLIAWPAPQHAVVLAVGPHDGSSSDVYSLLLTSLEITAPPGDRSKPACCDELGEPPADRMVTNVLTEAMTTFAARGRRQS